MPTGKTPLTYPHGLDLRHRSALQCLPPRVAGIRGAAGSHPHGRHGSRAAAPAAVDHREPGKPQHPLEPGQVGLWRHGSPWLIATTGWGSAESVQNLYSLYRFPDTPQAARLMQGHSPSNPSGSVSERIESHGHAREARDSTDALIVYLYHPVFRVWAGYGAFGI